MWSRTREQAWVPKDIGYYSPSQPIYHICTSSNTKFQFLVSISTHIAKKVFLGPNNAAYIIYVHIHFPEPKSNVSLNVNLHHQIRLAGTLHCHLYHILTRSLSKTKCKFPSPCLKIISTRLGLKCQTPVKVKPLPLPVQTASRSEALFSPSKDNLS